MTQPNIFAARERTGLRFFVHGYIDPTRPLTAAREGELVDRLNSLAYSLDGHFADAFVVSPQLMATLAAVRYLDTPPGVTTVRLGELRVPALIYMNEIPIRLAFITYHEDLYEEAQ